MILLTNRSNAVGYFTARLYAKFSAHWSTVDLELALQQHVAMFAELPSARADMKPGTLYAVVGDADWVYYGQVSPEKNIGFFRRRDREPAAEDAVLAAPIMAVVSVAYPSITRALRTRRWKKLGRFPVVGELTALRPSVLWPVGTLDVTVWIGDCPSCETRVDDPAIQDMELMAVWDAEHHIPARLTADFGLEKGEWHIGGPIHRERRIKEVMAARYPGQLDTQLPRDWVATSDR